MSIKSFAKKLYRTKIGWLIKPFRVAYGRYYESKLAFFLRYRPWMSDKKYLQRMHKQRFGCELNLDAPRTFNEKNNWRKLYDRNPLYTKMVDKHLLKEVVEDRCGTGYTIATLGVWKRPKEIPFDALPNQFVLKANHAGGVIICRNQADFDRKKAKKELRELLKTNYFVKSREWPYKNVPRRILAEEYMGENLVDYKNYCFNGKLLYTLVWKNVSREDGRKPKAHFCGSYDRNWIKTDMELDYPSVPDAQIEKPEAYEEMIRVAEALSKDIPFVRVDCYIIDGRVYVGEMTFFPWGGFQKFKDETWNHRLGALQILPNSND